MKSDFPERVQRGARWLDQHNPGWWQRVDLDILKMSDCIRCVLGQLHGTYEDGLRISGNLERGLDLAAEWAERHGFCIPTHAWHLYPYLTAAWQELIAARRAQQEEPRP